MSSILAKVQVAHDDRSAVESYGVYANHVMYANNVQDM